MVYIDGSFVKHKIRDSSQSIVGGIRQSLCVAGAGHDAEPEEECSTGSD